MKLKSFWNRYISALKKANTGTNGKLEKAILKHPLGALFCGMFILGLVMVAIWNTMTYIPPPPLPTMTISGFFNELQFVQLSWPMWVLIFLFLWLTKW